MNDAKPAGGELVQVPFYGDVIEAIRDETGQILVSIRRCCENIGVMFHGQLVKLRGYEWATVQEICTVAEDGKKRSMVMIDLARRANGQSYRKSVRLDQTASGAKIDLESLPNEWACVYEMYTHDTTGRMQQMTMSDLESLPMWRSHIKMYVARVLAETEISPGCGRLPHLASRRPDPAATISASRTRLHPPRRTLQVDPSLPKSLTYNDCDHIADAGKMMFHLRGARRVAGRRDLISGGDSVPT